MPVLPRVRRPLRMQLWKEQLHQHADGEPGLQLSLRRLQGLFPPRRARDGLGQAAGAGPRTGRDRPSTPTRTLAAAGRPVHLRQRPQVERWRRLNSLRSISSAAPLPRARVRGGSGRSPIDVSRASELRPAPPPSSEKPLLKPNPQGVRATLGRVEKVQFWMLGKPSYATEATKRPCWPFQPSDGLEPSDPLLTMEVLYQLS